ncbi:hypothetical protein B0H66DRAFT_592164 [Apodospora peruviana]|uniref:Uncharacterized protein n=1 Tax=Apodospora peruviana TaxID=516989 RepID=A0AAE0M210_9PEZI|nr:hypothetical protein B0H66DRAFT_592164 [Apodospora peruviana]
MDPGRQRSRQSNHVREHDIPDFKALPLLWPFLAVLFLFVCILTITLEYLLHTLPNEVDRNAIPHDSPNIPAKRGHRHQHNTSSTSSTYVTSILTERRGTSNWHPNATSVRTPRRSASTPVITHTTLTTSNVIRAANAPGTNPNPDPIADPDPIPIAEPDPRPPTFVYANTVPITTHITWADKWYGEAQHPFARTPLFPGEDPGSKCIYAYQGIVIISNSSSCLAYIDNWRWLR